MALIDEIIKDEIRKFVLEAYVPSTQNREIVPKEISDEELEQAEDILKQNVDPSWDVSKWGSFVIGVTGRYQVYYTFWKYTPGGSGYTGQVIYMGNLSTNIIDAAKKARKIAGIAPIFFEEYETLTNLKGAPADVIQFGKYRGKTLGEVYTIDPQYIIWIANKYDGGRGEKGREFRSIARELADGYFKSMGERNREAETKEYYGKPGEKFEGPVTLLKVDQYTNDYSGDYTFRLRTEDENSRFQFYVSPKALSGLLGVEYKSKMVQSGYGYSNITTPETINSIKAGLEKLKGTEINIKGTVKGHKEVVGKKWTTLSRVAFPK
jgi:hypothetical protein